MLLIKLRLLEGPIAVDTNSQSCRHCSEESTSKFRMDRMPKFYFAKIVKTMPLIRKYLTLINEKRVLILYLATAPSVVPNSSECQQSNNILSFSLGSL